MDSTKFEIQPHRRQFLIWSEEKPFREHWLSLPLSNGLYLSHCPELLLYKNKDFILLGEAVRHNEKLLSTTNIQTLATNTRNYSGKWALLSNAHIFTDAGAIMGVYYSKDSALISSSPKIIQEISQTSKRSNRKLGWYGMNWFPSPLTPLKGVKKLLRDQSLNIESFSINHIKRQDKAAFEKLENKEIAEQVNSRIIDSLKILSKKGKLKLALTAGIDSRVLLSALLKSQLKFSTYTLEHPLISQADIKIPKELSKEFGFKHSFISLKPHQNKLAKIFDEHIGGFTEDADKFFIEREMFKELGDDAILIRGGGWELGRKFYHSKLSEISWEDCKNSPKLLAKKFYLYGSLESSSEELGKWIEWREQHKSAYDWKDTFYLDQRVGAWLSTVELALDLISPVSVHPFSSAELFDLILAVQGESTDKNYIWNQIIMSNEKKLLVTPINPCWDPKIKKKTETLQRYFQALVNEMKNFYN